MAGATPRDKFQIGVVFPHTELSGDPAAVRDFAVAAEELGFSHMVAFDHVVGAHPHRPGYEGRYNSATPFTDPFVLFAFLAGITTTLQFASAVIILPQRQTVLVARQASDLARLSHGRFRLGVGTGWNEVEYESLGVPFARRGAREEAQVKLLRRLWEEETVELADEWHRLPNVGLAPRPAMPIPIWFGGNAEAVLRRVARMGDGWFPLARPGDDLEPMLERLDGYLDKAGRRRADVGIEGFVNSHGQEPERTARQIEAWRTLGATHVSLRTGPTVLSAPRPGTTVGGHIEVMRHVAEAAGLGRM